jgi:uncharacterized protein (DUF111 family)
MKIVYFDCFSGISGDMILGALIDLGLDPKTLTKHLSKLKLSGYEIEVFKEQRGPITGTRVNIKVDEEEQPPRSSDQIVELIGKSKLPDQVKKSSLAVLKRLATVEGNLHQQPPEHVHFHEVGAVDSMFWVLARLWPPRCPWVGDLSSANMERYPSPPLPPWPYSSPCLFMTPVKRENL